VVGDDFIGATDGDCKVTLFNRVVRLSH